MGLLKQYDTVQDFQIYGVSRSGRILKKSAKSLEYERLKAYIKKTKASGSTLGNLYKGRLRQSKNSIEPLMNTNEMVIDRLEAMANNGEPSLESVAPPVRERRHLRKKKKKSNQLKTIKNGRIMRNKNNAVRPKATTKAKKLRSRKKVGSSASTAPPDVPMSERLPMSVTGRQTRNSTGQRVAQASDQSDRRYLTISLTEGRLPGLPPIQLTQAEIDPEIAALVDPITMAFRGLSLQDLFSTAMKELLNEALKTISAKISQMSIDFPNGVSMVLHCLPLLLNGVLSMLTKLIFATIYRFKRFREADVKKNFTRGMKRIVKTLRAYINYFFA